MRNSYSSTPELIGEIIGNEKFLFGHPTYKEFNDAIDALNQKIDNNTALINALSQRLSEVEGDDTIDILSFTATPERSERGKAENVLLSWSIKGKPEQLILNGVPVSGTETTRTVNVDTDFVLTASNKSGSVSKSASVQFINFIYYGTTNNDTMDRSTVKALEQSIFTENVNMEFEIESENKYIVFAVPKRLGKVVFRSGGFDGGFKEPVVVSVDNHNTYYEDYYVYRSVQRIIGKPIIYTRKGE